MPVAAIVATTVWAGTHADGPREIKSRLGVTDRSPG
jgi:hypothetical protein